MILQSDVIQWIVFITIAPYWIFIILNGIALIRKFIRIEWPSKQKGIVDTVAKYEALNPEQRMITEMEKIKIGTEKATWLDSPTPKEEQKDMNERVFKEGLLHLLKPTVTQIPEEAERTI